MAAACSTAGGPRDEVVLDARVRPAGDAIDLLIVVDDSNGMGNQQILLSDEFDVLLDSVMGATGGRQKVVDLHVGVIDTDPGIGGYDVPTCEHESRGVLQGRGAAEGCPAEFDPPYVSSTPLEPNDGGPTDPNGLDLATEFGCIATLGDDGCGMEQPLQSLRLAMTDRVLDGANAGFFRRRALLGVLIVSEEDDCSATDPAFFDPDREDLADVQVRCYVHPEQLEPVAVFADLLTGQRPTGRVVLGGWISVPVGWDGDLAGLSLDPSLDWRTATDRDFVLCENARGVHFKAPRLAALVLAMGEDGFAWSQCEGSIDDDIAAFGELLRRRLDPPSCLPAQPRDESRCEVVLELLEETGGCPPGTVEASDGTCELQREQWELVETTECTELRPAGGLVVPDASSLRITCHAR